MSNPNANDGTTQTASEGNEKPSASKLTPGQEATELRRRLLEIEACNGCTNSDLLQHNLLEVLQHSRAMVRQLVVFSMRSANKVPHVIDPNEFCSAIGLFMPTAVEQVQSGEYDERGYRVPEGEGKTVIEGIISAEQARLASGEVQRDLSGVDATIPPVPELPPTEPSGAKVVPLVAPEPPC